MKKWKKFLNESSIHKISSATFILILILLVFFAGYSIANVRNKNFIPRNINGVVNSSNDVDFSTFWRVWDILDRKFISTNDNYAVDNQERVYGAIAGMVDSLGDPYTVFLRPRENKLFNESISGNFSGVGMEIGIRNEFLTVISPIKNTPAQRAGIKSGDVILEIDGLSTNSMDLDEAVNNIRGQIGTKVSLKIIRENLTEPINIEITRDNIEIPTLDFEIKNGVFIISVHSFSSNVNNDFRKALREFATSGTNKLILDLRGNPGGYLDSAVDMASWFLPSGKVVVQEDFGPNQTTKFLRSKGYNIFNENLRMLVLINGGSASASEIVAGALQEHGVAKLLGSKTFGKGSVQELIQIDSETSIKITIAQWLTPLGKSISKGGLEPDYIIEKDLEGIELFEHQMNEALRIINEM